MEGKIMSCIFCDIVAGKSPCRKIYEDDLIIGIMDIDPFCDGHALLIPKKHYTDMMDLDEEILKHINHVAKELTPMLMEKLGKVSMTISYNYGEKQKVKHFHVHLLPNIDDDQTEDVATIYEKICTK